MLTSKDLTLCHGRAQTILLLFFFFCLQFWVVAVGDVTAILGFYFLSFDQKTCSSCGEKFTVFLVLRSTWAATRNSLSIKDSAQIRIVRKQLPKHLFDLHKKATAQVLLSSHANLEVPSDPQCPKVHLVCLGLPKNGRTSTDNHYVAFDSNNLQLQPFSRKLYLLNFARILLPVKRTLSHLKIERKKLSFVQQDLGEYLLVVGLRDVFA